MSSPRSYIVRIWRREERGGAAVLGVVEELVEKQNEGSATMEEFLGVLRSRKTPCPGRRKTFSSFEELRRILTPS